MLKENFPSHILQDHAYEPVSFPETVSLNTIIEVEINLTN